MNNALDYSFLVKDLELHKKIEKMQKIKNWLSWAFSILSIVAILLRIPSSENHHIKLVFSSIIMLNILAVIVYNLHFFSLINKNRKSQVLSEENYDDLPFISLNEKYTNYSKFIKKINVAMTLVSMLGLILFVVAIILSEFSSYENLTPLIIIGFAIFVASIVAYALITVFKQQNFAKNATSEIEQIRHYFYREEGLTEEQISKKKKHIFTNMYDANKTLTYLYPDETIRKNIQKLSYIMFFPSILAGIILGTLASSALINKNAVLFYIGLGIFATVLTVSTILHTKKFKALVNQQRVVFDTDTEKYKHNITLADLTKDYQKKLNTVMLLLSVTAVTAAIICAILDQVGTTVALIIIILTWSILVLIIFVISYIKYRSKAKLIELEIDKNNVEKP